MHPTSRRTGDRIDDLDRAISRAVSEIPPSPFDTVMKAVSQAADHGLLWFATAALLATRRGATRRGAVRGVVALGCSSVVANAVLKPLLPRRRPAASELPAYQTIPDPPTSSSFPSGHSASAAAFATAFMIESPAVGVVLAPLAAAVAYSRIHVGVHWATDVAAGAALGTTIALASRRWWPAPGA
ncbi:phosphatase PAP2 family protein [Pseudonocardia sp. GCM10023141]|uniref:phosphatase PAP2 family protein n=1 Tax=Pseudonocardia sp. GCM10023141 TaxID=3252653 RepID=UPI00361FD8BB